MFFIGITGFTEKLISQGVIALRSQDFAPTAKQQQQKKSWCHSYHGGLFYYQEFNNFYYQEFNNELKYETEPWVDR